MEVLFSVCNVAGGGVAFGLVLCCSSQDQRSAIGDTMLQRAVATIGDENVAMRQKVVEGNSVGDVSI